MRKVTLSVLAFLVIAVIFTSAILAGDHKPTTPHKGTAYCVLARTPEIDGVPVYCLNTGKLATQADFRHVCFTDGYGIELYNVAEGKFDRMSCDASIPDMTGYAGYWAAVVFTYDNKIANVGAWHGDNYVIFSGNTSNAHAGTDASMVAYLQAIDKLALAASQGR